MTSDVWWMAIPKRLDIPWSKDHHFDASHGWNHWPHSCGATQVANVAPSHSPRKPSSKAWSLTASCDANSSISSEEPLRPLCRLTTEQAPVKQLICICWPGRFCGAKHQLPCFLTIAKALRRCCYLFKLDWLFPYNEGLLASHWDLWNLQFSMLDLYFFWYWRHHVSFWPMNYESMSRHGLVRSGQSTLKIDAFMIWNLRSGHLMNLQ